MQKTKADIYPKPRKGAALHSSSSATIPRIQLAVEITAEFSTRILLQVEK